MKNIHYTYKKSGVNITSASKLVKHISKISKKTNKYNPDSKFLNNIGNFGSIFDLSKVKIKSPHLVTSTDGVGTKIEIANEINKFDTIGIDLVAMCVNDVIVMGAKPYFFLDYLAIGKLKEKKVKQILKGIINGCVQANCALVGGETAEMPGIYTNNKFDLAGFTVGLVDKNNIFNRKDIKEGDVILAVPSTGLHSNGYSLIRNILKSKRINLNKKSHEITELRKLLIEPTKIYVKEIMMLNKKKLIKGCAHITGGGIIENLPRVLPSNLSAIINLNKIKPMKIFRWLKKNNLTDNEMLNTFNCGVGFCLIANRKKIKNIEKIFTKKFKPYEIGFISKGTFNIKTNGNLQL